MKFRIRSIGSHYSEDQVKILKGLGFVFSEHRYSDGTYYKESDGAENYIETAKDLYDLRNLIGRDLIITKGLFGEPTIDIYDDYRE